MHELINGYRNRKNKSVTTTLGAGIDSRMHKFAYIQIYAEISRLRVNPGRVRQQRDVRFRHVERCHGGQTDFGR
jgi:hypothetical protein